MQGNRSFILGLLSGSGVRLRGTVSAEARGATPMPPAAQASVLRERRQLAGARSVEPRDGPAGGQAAARKLFKGAAAPTSQGPLSGGLKGKILGCRSGDTPKSMVRPD